MFGHGEYLALMAACVLITLPLELVFAARVYRRWTMLLAALVPVVLIFAVWDLIAIARDHWTFNPEFVTGIEFGPLPLEELVFFIVIPICALLSYEAVGTVLDRAQRRRRRPPTAETGTSPTEAPAPTVDPGTRTDPGTEFDTGREAQR